MKAVIMAGGTGIRLQPLTCTIPKPMLRLCGKPVLEYILDLLDKHNFNTADITLMYLSNVIKEHFLTDRYKNIKLNFITETFPFGTAGSVRNAADNSEQDMLVISGDILCDFDLTAAIAAHHEKKSDVTILCKRVFEHGEYDMVRCDSSGQIVGFVENPSFLPTVSELANCGIYILSSRAVSLIPREVSCDFTKDLFTKLLADNFPIYCYEAMGYWCDINKPTDYLKCQQDMLLCKVNCEIHGNRDTMGNILKDEKPHGNYTLEPPVYIGKNVSISNGAKIQSGSIIDDNSCISEDAKITNSVLFCGCFVGANSTLDRTILCENSSVKHNSTLLKNSILGANSVVGIGSIIKQNIKIWDCKTVADGVILQSHLKSGESSMLYFDDDGLCGELGIDLTPEYSARLGCAIASVCVTTSIGIAFSEHRGAQILAQSLISGVQACGIGVLSLGEALRSEFDFFMDHCSLELGIYIKCNDNGTVQIQLAGIGGLPVSRKIERSVEHHFMHNEFRRCPSDRLGDCVNVSGLLDLYQTQLLRLAPYGLNGLTAQFISKNSSLADNLNHAIKSLGCNVGDELTFTIGIDGKGLSLDYGHGVLDYNKILLLCCMEEFELGHTIAISYDMPRAIEKAGIPWEGKVVRYLSCPIDDSDKEARNIAAKQQWIRNPAMLAIKLLANIKLTKLGLDDMIIEAPKSDFYSAELPSEGNPEIILNRLTSDDISCGIGNGIVLQSEQSTVIIRPSKTGKLLKIFAESFGVETAEEICSKITDKIRHITNNNVFHP